MVSELAQALTEVGMHQMISRTEAVVVLEVEGGGNLRRRIVQLIAIDEAACDEGKEVGKSRLVHASTVGCSKGGEVRGRKAGVHLITESISRSIALTDG